MHWCQCSGRAGLIVRRAAWTWSILTTNIIIITIFIISSSIRSAQVLVEHRQLRLLFYVLHLYLLALLISAVLLDTNHQGELLSSAAKVTQCVKQKHTKKRGPQLTCSYLLPQRKCCSTLHQVMAPVPTSITKLFDFLLCTFL